MDKEIKILIVDDEVDFTETMSFWFKSKGYLVVVANDGTEAIKVFKSERPDVVFLDLMIPPLNGVDTLRKIREINKNTPVVMITAYVDQMRVREVEPLGIAGVFYKGKDFEETLSMLESILRTHKNLKNK